MELHSASAEDELQIKQLLAECDLPHEDIAASHLKHFFVLRDGDQLSGVIGIELHGLVALLRSLAVKEERRCSGLGTQLVRRAEQHAREQGAEKVYLLTTTAERFFAWRGYHKVDRTTVPVAIQECTEFCALCPSTAVCMLKDLRAPRAGAPIA
jgi:amino-acid N-acetyltransferase